MNNISREMALRDIEHELLTIHNELCIRNNADKARRAGELLIAGKAQKPHGHYLSWVRSMGIHQRTAQVYVQVAKSPKAHGSAPLTIDTLLRFIRAGKKAQRKERGVELARAAHRPTQDPAIIAGDALDWLKAQADGSIPFVVTDPPYGLGFTYEDWTEPNNPADWWTWFRPFWQEMTRVLQPGGSVVLWQPYRNLRHLSDWFEGSVVIANCFIVRGVRIWEPLMKWVKPGADPLIPPTPHNDWFAGDNRHQGRADWATVHPCPKPLADCREVIRRYTLPGCLVADPFCGVGTIPLACKLEGRVYVGVERSATYASLARKRLADATDIGGLDARGKMKMEK